MEKRYTKNYIILCIGCLILTVIGIYLGFEADRLPEMLIIIGCFFIFVTVLYMMHVHESVWDRDITEAYAGRQFVNVQCLCKKDNNVSKSSCLQFCKNGVLLFINNFYELIDYKDMKISHVNKFQFKLSYLNDKQQNHEYLITVNKIVEVKAILQLLESKQIAVNME